MQIGETRRLKKVVLGVETLPVKQDKECTCKWEDDDGEYVTVTLAKDCKVHKPWPREIPRVRDHMFA